MNLAGLLDAAEVEIEVAGLPPLRVGVGGESSPLARALRPAVTLRVGGAQLVRVAPHGEPSQGFPLAGVAVFVGALGLGALVWLALR